MDIENTLDMDIISKRKAKQWSLEQLQESDDELVKILSIDLKKFYAKEGKISDSKRKRTARFIRELADIRKMKDAISKEIEEIESSPDWVVSSVIMLSGAY